MLDNLEGFIYIFYSPVTVELPQTKNVAANYEAHVERSKLIKFRERMLILYGTGRRLNCTDLFFNKEILIEGHE